MILNLKRNWLVSSKLTWGIWRFLTRALENQGTFVSSKKAVSFLIILLKKRLWCRCFPVNFAKLLRTLFFYRTPPVAASGYTVQEAQFSNYNRITDLSFFCHIYPRTNSTMIYFHESVLFVAFTAPFTTFFLRVWLF